MKIFSSLRQAVATRMTRMRDRLRKLFLYDHWMIGVIHQPIEKALTWHEMPPVMWLNPVMDKHYLADPFPWPDSSDTLLCEEYDVAARKGHLAALKIDGDGTILDRLKIDLPLQGHLSFPFLFMKDGQLFMMPESCADRRLDLFVWAAGGWHSYAPVLRDRAVADAILFEKDGLFWISYTDVYHHPHDNLNLIYADDLRGPWTAHPANPVCRGLDRSRNGGAVFRVADKWYRPAQDCSRVYGGSLRIMEIVTCTPEQYREREVTHILPSSRLYPHGFHTLSAWGDKCLVDGMRLRFSWRLMIQKLRRRFM